MKKPNILFFMTDQFGAKWFEEGLRGAYEMPNFKRLKESGVYFRNAICNNPVCGPARSVIMTGLSSRSNGVLENGMELDERIMTFPRYLQEQGWNTANFGKLHLKTHYNGPYHDYKPYGFDEVKEVNDLYCGEWLDWIQKEHPEHYNEALLLVWPMMSKGLQHYGADGRNLRTEAITARDGGKAYDRPVKDGKKVVTTPFAIYNCPLPDELTPSAWITANAVDYIKRKANDEKPFMVHVSYTYPHDPFNPPARCLDKVNTDMISEPVPETWMDDPNHPKHFDYRGVHQGISEHWKLIRQYYYACISYLDEQLGALLDALEETGTLDNTYIIMTSDHGEMLCDHGFQSKHNRHYDACVRVPLIMAGPGIRENVERDEIVQQEDFFPTILEMTGCPKPEPHILPDYKVWEEYPSVLAGHSMLPICRGEEDAYRRDAAYVESYSYWANVQPMHWARSIRTHKFRYTYYPCGGGEQLFDLENDPDEKNNLACDPAYRDTVNEMKGILLEKSILQDSPKSPLNHLFYHEFP